MMRVSVICAAAVSLTALSAPALASDDAQTEALADQMISLCDAALGPQGLEGAAQEIGATLKAFDFPVADRDITASDRALVLPQAEGLSIWTGMRDGETVCVMGAQDDNLRVVREVEAKLRAEDRNIAHNTVNLAFGFFSRGTASVRVVELAASR
ncbi:hypothetical protein ACFELO_00555 [Oceanicaulis sp. LC35]|uniref:hypothetical protein n=1 Tax=Oceanicaulis sp. LC35 TaxID=3349635 RepID=UPI003F84E257